MTEQNFKNKKKRVIKTREDTKKESLDFRVLWPKFRDKILQEIIQEVLQKTCG